MSNSAVDEHEFRDPRILVWDLETTDLKGNFGHLLTVAATWIGSEEMWTWRIDDHPDYGSTPESMMNDEWMVQGIVDVINESDMLVHQFGDRFDLPFINSRALAWGLLPPNQIRTIDTWKVARSNLALTSNRLGSLADFLNDPDAQKGGLSKTEWKLAAHGDREVLDKMVEYNIEDVIATEEVYKRLRPLIKNHPYMAAPTQPGETRTRCPACNSQNTDSTGSYYTKTQHVRRRRCTECHTPFEEGRSVIK